MSSSLTLLPFCLLFFNMFSISNCDGYNYIRNKQKCFAFICGTDYVPLCGSDGQTYPNSCKFAQAKCMNPKLTVFLQGACEDIGTNLHPPNSASTYDMVATSTDVCGISQECSMENDPICGSDGKIYRNDCFFTRAYCKNRNLSATRKRNCPTSEVADKCQKKICPFEEEALCASNGKTYRNDCEFQQIKCYRPDLNILHKGKCEPNTEVEEGNCQWDCNEIDRPLCGTDGVNYKNMCEFERGQCINKSLKVHKFEPC